MKTNFLLAIQLFCSSTMAQNLEAKYQVLQTINATPTEPKATYVTLEYEGFLYKSGSKNIYFQKPLYLKKYPGGGITINLKPGVYAQYTLIQDSIQRISYNDLDSLIFRMSSESSPPISPRDFYVRNFELGVHEWEILPETRKIDGLICQRAKYYRDALKKDLAWDVWFCPEIDVNFGPTFIRDIPGLVVEADLIGLNEKYKLVSYNTTKQIDRTLFWPKEFASISFKNLPPLKKSVPNPIKSKNQKRAEIIINQ